MRRTRAAVLGAISATACFRDQPPASEGGTAAAATSSSFESSGSETSIACECTPEESCIEGTCVPVGCGDGVVGADEECDEGPANAENGACKLDCTLQVCGDGALGATEGCDDGNLEPGDGCDATCVLESCGNGTIDDGEACDDGNRTQGDGCNDDCEPSGVLVWEHLHDGAVGGPDVANDIAVVPETGEVVVVGAVMDDPMAHSTWFRVLDPNGAVHLTSPTTASTEGGAWLFGLDCEPERCVAIGHQQHPTNLFTTIIRTFSPDGAVDDTVELPNPSANGRIGYDVAIAPFGLDIAGSVQNGLVDRDGVLEELDEALTPTNAYPLLPGVGLAVVRRIQRVGDRRFVSGWSVAEGLVSAAASVLIVNADGSIASSIDVVGSEFTLAASLAVDGSGESVIVAGSRSGTLLMDGPGSAVLRRYGNDEALQWQMDGNYGGEAARFEDVAIAGNGDIVAVGAVRAKGGTDDVLVARHGAGGEPRWTRVVSDAGSDVGFAVAIDPKSDAILVAGRRTVDGSDDVWVGHYTP